MKLFYIKLWLNRHGLYRLSDYELDDVYNQYGGHKDIDWRYIFRRHFPHLIREYEFGPSYIIPMPNFAIDGSLMKHFTDNKLLSKYLD